MWLRPNFKPHLQMPVQLQLHRIQLITAKLKKTTLCSEKNTHSRFLLYLHGKCLHLPVTQNFLFVYEELSILGTQKSNIHCYQ